MQLTWETIVTNLNWTFVINLVQFLLLVVILNRLIYRPLIRFMDEREARLSAQFHRAERQREEAEALRQRRETELHEAGMRARAALEAARREAGELRRQLREEAETESQKIIQAARHEAEKQLRAVRAELETQIDHLAEIAAAQVLGRVRGERS